MMANKTQYLMYGALLSGIILMSGCRPSLNGNYTFEIRVKRDLEGETDSDKIASLPSDLAKAQEQHSDFVDQLHIKPGGRYWQQDAHHQFEGDWWIANDGRLATRTTHQDGKSLNALISEGADRNWEIGSDGNLYRYWNSPDSNLEYVFVKQ